MITATAAGFPLGTSTLQVTDSNSRWHNAINPYDVDADNTISPLDVLVIINYLNLVGSGPVPTGSPPPFLDVDSDNFISPLDVLVVINFLNAKTNGQGEGEGMSMRPSTALIDDFFVDIARLKSSAMPQRLRSVRAPHDFSK